MRAGGQDCRIGTGAMLLMEGSTGPVSRDSVLLISSQSWRVLLSALCSICYWSALITVAAPLCS